MKMAVHVFAKLVLPLMYAHAFCSRELELLFEDCSAFNDDSYFGGQVCGSDGDTYPNWLYIRCLNYNNLSPYSDIYVRYKGPCTPLGQKCPYSPFYKPVCATDDKTYANIEILSCLATTGLFAIPLGVLYEEECQWDQVDPCLRSNWQLWGFNSVCANNGLTYHNIAQLRCLQNIQPDLEVMHDGGCSLTETRSAPRTKEEVCWLANNRYEWNPICANNNITYPNPFIMLCYEPELKAKFQGECNNPIYLSCLRARELVEEHNADHLVCGSDGNTYASLDHLVCATTDDKYLWSLHDGPCTSEDDPCERREWFPTDTRGNPVCATDGNTYVSPAAMWCSQRTYNPCLKFLHDGPCIPQQEHLS